PAPPPRSSPPAPPPRSYPPPAVVEAAPPPLSPAMRDIYAPFYAAGLVIRYGVYYVIVAPLEVFGRALNYGVEGGVARGDDRWQGVSPAASRLAWRCACPRGPRTVEAATA